MAGVGFDDSASDLLEGRSDVIGGLVIKKAPSKHVFRSPQGSMLGLQKLAEEKRKRKEELESGEEAKKAKRSTTSSEPSRESWGDEASSGDIDSRTRFSSGSGREQRSVKSRHYRSHLEETPSHTGGVSEEAREKQLRRMERDREGRRGGVYAESRSREHRSSDEGRSRDRYSEGSKGNRSGDRDRRGSSRGERAESRSRDRPSERGSSRGREPSSRRSEWEETPERSSRRREVEGSYTPRHKPEGVRATSRHYTVQPRSVELGYHKFPTLSSCFSLPSQ